MKRLFTTVSLVLLLSACALFTGLEKPQTFQDQAAYLKAGVSAGLRSSAAALRNNTPGYKVEDAEKVQAYAIQVRDGIKLGESLYGTCVSKIPATTTAPGASPTQAAVTTPVPQSVIQSAIDACAKGDALAQLKLTEAVLEALKQYLIAHGVK